MRNALAAIEVRETDRDEAMAAAQETAAQYTAALRALLDARRPLDVHAAAIVLHEAREADRVAWAIVARLAG